MTPTPDQIKDAQSESMRQATEKMNVSQRLKTETRYKEKAEAALAERTRELDDLKLEWSRLSGIAEARDKALADLAAMTKERDQAYSSKAFNEDVFAELAEKNYQYGAELAVLSERTRELKGLLATMTEERDEARTGVSRLFSQVSELGGNPFKITGEDVKLLRSPASDEEEREAEASFSAWYPDEYYKPYAEKGRFLARSLRATKVKLALTQDSCSAIASELEAKAAALKQAEARLKLCDDGTPDARGKFRVIEAESKMKEAEAKIAALEKK